MPQYVRKRPHCAPETAAALAKVISRSEVPPIGPASELPTPRKPAPKPGTIQSVADELSCAKRDFATCGLRVTALTAQLKNMTEFGK